MAKDTRQTELEQAKLQAEIEELALKNKRLAIDLAHGNLSIQQARESFAVRGEAHRVYHFNDVVHAGSVPECMSALDALAKLDATAPIEIIFNSPGGSVLDGLELFDFIRQLRAKGTPINTTISGMAASMAGILSQAGETRRITQSAYLLIHEIGSIQMGKLSQLKDATKFSERLYDRTLGILAKRSTLSVDEIRDKAERRDWILDADEALALGFVDEILPYVTETRESEAA